MSDEPSQTPQEADGQEAADALPRGAAASETADSSEVSDPTAAGSKTPGDDSNWAQRNAWTSESWGQAARAACVFALLGMALCVFIRLSLGEEWVTSFLKSNKISMGNRMVFIYQIVGSGSLAASLVLGSLLHLTPSGRIAARFEQWAWFLAPLILLPAVPVMLQHTVWVRKHNELLPVVLFGAILAEFLFSKALSNVPAAVSRTLKRLWEDSTTEVKTENAALRAQRFVETHLALILVTLAAIAYGIFMSFYTVRWHEKLGTATFDLGINNNLLYGGLEGKFNQSPVIFPDDPQKYLANHVKLGLYTLLPIYAIFPRAETLLIIQSVSLGLGAVPLFLFARRRLPQWWAVGLALSYLAYYPMHGANFYEMKVVPTSATLVLTCIWAIDSKRFITGGIFFAWALIMREDMPVPLAVVGAVFLLSGARPKAGLIMTGVATTWFILLRFRFMNDVGSWWFPNMYEDLWAHPDRGFQGVIKTLVSNPTFTLKHIFVEKKFWYLMHLLVPMAFLPVRRWWAWAAFVPGAILTLLVTDYAPPTMFSFQYVMHWSPYLYVAAALVLASKAVEANGRNKALAALLAMGLASATLSYNYGAFPARDKALESGYHKITFGFSEKEAETLADVRRMVASIPRDASVGSTERVGAHLSSRVGFYTLRRGAHGVDYMVARKKGLRLDRTKQTVRDALKSGEYGVHERFGDFIVFKRGADTKDNKKVLREWHLARKPKSKKARRRNRRKERDEQRKKKPTKDRTPNREPDLVPPRTTDASRPAPQKPRLEKK